MKRKNDELLIDNKRRKIIISNDELLIDNKQRKIIISNDEYRDILGLIFLHVDICDWKNVKLTCKSFKRKGNIIFNPSKYNNAFMNAIKNESYESALYLLQDGRAHPNQSLVEWTCTKGYIEIMELLMKDNR